MKVTVYEGTADEIAELLQAIASSLEQKCGLCDEYANLELDNGNFICDTCAQIVGEKAEM
ncbi:TPA: hypothetical protein ACGBG5_003441 [Enterococcus faecalis]